MTSRTAAPVVVLIGPPGAGKSAVGPLLADRLGVEFRDTDADVGAAAGKPVSDIFVEDGEHATVLGLGSGAVLDPGIQQSLQGLPVVYLAADFSTVAHRTGLDRPRVVIPGNPRGRLRAMLEERRPLYERLAAVTVETDDYDPEELAEQIAATLTEDPL